MPEAVIRSLADPARLCPMFAGPAMICGNVLVVRVAEEDIEVKADPRLLKKLFRLCDGTRSLKHILDDMAGKKEGELLGEFLSFLLETGALIDASLYTAAALRYGFSGNPFGLTADSSVSGLIARRFTAGTSSLASTVPDTALDLMFDGRISTTTFDDGDIGANPLRALLWSLCGIVKMTHDGQKIPRRTIASAGGMHLTEVYLALRKSAGDLVPGVYRVRYPDEKCVAFEFVADVCHLLPRAFMMPWLLSHATGAIFILGDVVTASLRYKNRALQYLFMEAGAALQNGGLTAPTAGLGYLTVGGYDQRIVQQMCNAGEKVVLGTALFGPAPSARQLELAAFSPDIEFAWVDQPSTAFMVPGFMARAKIKGEKNAMVAWGRDADPWQAYTKAVAEAIERQGFVEPKALVRGKISGFENAMHPDGLVRYSEAQYRSEGFPYQRFDPEREHEWVTGTALGSGRAVTVLAALVYHLDPLVDNRDADQQITHSSTSGCAAGTSLEHALRRALLEVLERDAFMRHWFAQKPGLEISRDSLPASLLARIGLLEQAGCRVVIQKMQSVCAQATLVSAQHDQKHFTSVGASAHFSMASAIDSALGELESQVFSRLNGHTISIKSPLEVRSPQDHFELYGLKRYFRRADNILRPMIKIGLDQCGSPSDDSVDGLVMQLTEAGYAPMYVDISPRLGALDQGRKNLTVVRAMIPGLIPISFGTNREPRAMASGIHAASKFPHPFS